MKGNTLAQFMDDILLTGGPEKEFVFRNQFFFLETVLCDDGESHDLYIDVYDNSDPLDKKYIKTHHFVGKTMAECVSKFECATIFCGLTIYQAEQEIVVLFG